MGNFHPDYGAFDLIGSSFNDMPIQYLPKTQKTTNWKRATVDYLETYGLKALRKNEKFAEYRKMKDGENTYIATDFIREYLDDDGLFDSFPIFNSELPEWVRHFDFTSIIINAFQSVYNERDDRYRVKSEDAFSTNEFIRFKTEILQQNAALLFQEELNKMLVLRGFDPARTEFESEQEQQQYQQQLQEQVQALTPKEMEEFATKNYKIIAIEWAQTTLTKDVERHGLIQQDLESFVDFLLSGRWFRHYRTKFDTYTIERWLPEETFFSEEIDTKHPQKGEFVGRIRYMGISTILNTYGHRMSPRTQKRISEYFGKPKSYKNYSNIYAPSGYTSGFSPDKAVFPKQVAVPFQDYFVHKELEAIEDFTGIPMGTATILDEDGEEKSFACNMTRTETGYSANRGRFLRSDIDLRKDSIRVTEGYWRSYKRMGLLVMENEYGQPEVSIVDDDLEKDFLKDNNITENKSKSLTELRKLMQDEDYNEILGTITYFPVPEVWGFVKFKGNGTTLDEDIYLDVAPLDFQIKGTESNMFDVLLPVTGLIDKGIIPHIINEQIGYNINMNQVTELTQKELGVIFALDVKGVPSEYKNESVMETLHNMWQAGKDSGIIPLDYSKGNTSNDTTPFLQRYDLSLATDIQNKWAIAKNYRQDAFSKLGISPELLGAPNAYATAEGVKQGVNSSMALMSPHIEKFESSKVEAMNFHLAFAQFCQVTGIDANYIYSDSDQNIRYIDIMKEDPEIFPLRRLGVVAEVSQKDRKVVETLKNVIANNNTIVNSLDDLITIYTNPVLSSLASDARRLKAEKEAQERQGLESQERMNQENIAATERATQAKYEHEINLRILQGEIDKNLELIEATGRAADAKADSSSFQEINEAYEKASRQENEVANRDIKQQEVFRKTQADDRHNSVELQKLALKAKEISMKQQEMRMKERIALTPKRVDIV